MGTSVDDLVALLDLERVEEDLFRGTQPGDEVVRVFGGQVAAQALVAAGRTVEPGRHVHSLHAYFLRPGDPAAPIVYEVDRIRDGRSFTTRRVVAVQRGRAIFNLQTSFAAPEEGLEHEDAAPEVPAPEDTPTLEERLRPYGGQMHAWWTVPRPVEVRSVGLPPTAVGAGETESRSTYWMRTTGALPDDPLLHAAVLTYASDMTLLDAALLRHGLGWGPDGVVGASLDHAMWFHRPVRADDWFLYDQHSAWAGSSRALTRGALWSDGRRVASVAQEGLIRLARKAGA